MRAAIAPVYIYHSRCSYFVCSLTSWSAVLGYVSLKLDVADYTSHVRSDSSSSILLRKVMQCSVMSCVCIGHCYVMFCKSRVQ